MSDIHLSTKKISELQKEAENIRKAIVQVATERKQDGHMHEGIIEEINLQPKRRRLTEIEQILKKAKILPKKVESSTVVLGSFVTIQNKEGRKRKIRIVHSLESNPAKNLISIDSPLGKILKGKKKGQAIPLREHKWEILNVS